MVGIQVWMCGTGVGPYLLMLGRWELVHLLKSVFTEQHVTLATCYTLTQEKVHKTIPVGLLLLHLVFYLHLSSCSLSLYPLS